MERLCVAFSTGVLLAVLVALVAPNPTLAIDCGRNKSHNVFMGHRVYGDQLLFMDHPEREGKWLRTVSADSKSGPLPRLINYVEVIDGYRDGKGGCAYLTNGGVGTNNVSFHLKSQRSNGLNFTIRVYGR